MPTHFVCSGKKHAKKIASLALATTLCSIVGLVPSPPAQSQTWNGPTFREFSGVNHTGNDANLSLYGNALSWDRRDVIWATLEPSPGQWNEARLEAWGQHLLKMRAAGAEVLPVLVYTAPWAADKSSRTWVEGNNKWEASPREDGKMNITRYSLQPDKSWLAGETRVAGDLSRFPPADVEHWKNYVSRVVKFLRQAPYNVEYFQVWNEAYPTSGFWQGSLDEYIQKIHLPAADVIRSLGGKVVYGGWPSVTNVNPMIWMLDRNKAWDSIDVLDVHYQLATQLEILRTAAIKRGYPDMPIWETEMGYSGNKLFVADQYPRLLHWALSSNWDRPNKYLMMYYAHQVPNDPANPEYGRNLWTGTQLSPHGQTLQTLANLLDGGKLSLQHGVTSTPTLTPRREINQGSLEAFTVADRIVIAVHTTPDIYANTANFSLSLPLPVTEIAKAERVDLVGNRQDVTQELTAAGATTSLDVAVKDAEGTKAREWNEATKGNRVFYVVITKNEG